MLDKLLSGQVLPISLRRAEAGDIPVLLRLKYVLADRHADVDDLVETAGLERFDRGWIEASLADLNNATSALAFANYWVAIAGGLIVGMICINWFDQARRIGADASVQDRLLSLVPHSMLISDMAVFRRFRRNGIASRLMETAEGKARALGIGRIALMVEQDNKPALALYRKFGFSPRAGRRIKAAGKDHRRMLLLVREVEPDKRGAARLG